MEPEAPCRLPRRTADQFGVLFDDLVRRRAREEVEVECAADRAVLDERDVGRRRREQEDV